MSSAIGVGNEVPLVLDVGDANDTLYIRVTVFQPNQSILSVLNLVAKGDGRYSFAGYLMPEFDYITTKFVVYSDNSYTTRAGYYDVVESFSKSEASSGGDNGDLIDTINSAIAELRRVDVTMDIIEDESVEIAIDSNDTPDRVEVVVEDEESKVEVVITDKDMPDEVEILVEDDGNIVIENN